MFTITGLVVSIRIQSPVLESAKLLGAREGTRPYHSEGEGEDRGRCQDLLMEQGIVGCPAPLQLLLRS